MVSATDALILGGTAALYFILGALWYSPVLFGNFWMKTINKTPADLKDGHNMIAAMSVSYLVCLAQVFVMAMVVTHLKVQSVIYSMIIGAMIALAFGLLSAVRSHFYEARNLRLMVIDHGYDIVGGAMAAGLLTALLLS